MAENLTKSQKKDRKVLRRFNVCLDMNALWGNLSEPDQPRAFTLKNFNRFLKMLKEGRVYLDHDCGMALALDPKNPEDSWVPCVPLDKDRNRVPQNDPFADPTENARAAVKGVLEEVQKWLDNTLDSVSKSPDVPQKVMAAFQQRFGQLMGSETGTVVVVDREAFLKPEQGVVNVPESPLSESSFLEWLNAELAQVMKDKKTHPDSARFLDGCESTYIRVMTALQSRPELAVLAARV